MFLPDKRSIKIVEEKLKPDLIAFRVVLNKITILRKPVQDFFYCKFVLIFFLKMDYPH